ncbi:YbhB/YbcL family Raf kinase inhibitor-like protein [Candidatus Omnitrophota bacterium]
MKNGLFFRVFIILIAFFLIAGNGYSLEIKSGAFEEGGTIPIQYAGKGKDVSPGLSWSDVPEGTKSFALIMDDPDAPFGTWIHWVVFNIPGDATGLKENIPRKATLDDGTLQGINSFRWIGYGGPHPPPGPKHRYFFKLYALDTVLELSPGTSKGKLVRAMQGHILDDASLMGTFGS